MNKEISITNNFRNNKISIFSLAKSTGETWFEHSKASYHVGRVLWTLVNDEISKYLTKDEFLWCCFFHDAGKLMWKGFDDDHTPYTKCDIIC